jgi:hypothetical protein
VSSILRASVVVVLFDFIHGLTVTRDSYPTPAKDAFVVNKRVPPFDRPMIGLS